MNAGERWTLWFVFGLCATLAVLISMAPRAEHTPDNAALRSAPAHICGPYGTPTRAVRTDQVGSITLYDVYCSGITGPLQASW